MNKILIAVISLVLISFVPTRSHSQNSDYDETAMGRNLATDHCISGFTHEHGVVLEAEKLRTILNADLATVGLAFKIKSSNNGEVQLELLQVNKKQLDSYSTFSSVACEIKVVDEFGKSVEPNFKFKRVRKNSKFSFALASRDQLELLLAGGHEKFLLSGTKLRYDRQIGGKREIFTFILEAYPSINDKMTHDGYLGTPDYCILEACPPFWTPDGL